MGEERRKLWERGLIAGGRVAVRGLVAWEKKGESDGQVGERKKKKRKGKWVGLLHWASVWARKWRWEMGQVGLEWVLG